MVVHALVTLALRGLVRRFQLAGGGGRYGCWRGCDAGIGRRYITHVVSNRFAELICADDEVVAFMSQHVLSFRGQDQSRFFFVDNDCIRVVAHIELQAQPTITLFHFAAVDALINQPVQALAW